MGTKFFRVTSLQVYEFTSGQVNKLLVIKNKLVPMLLCLSSQAVHLSTGSLVYLPCYFVFYLPCLQATCSLVYLFTRPLYIVKKRKRCLQEEGFNLKSCFYSFVLVLLWWESLNILIRRLEKYKKRYIQ